MKVFKREKYLSNPAGGDEKRTEGITEDQVLKAKKKGIPDIIIQKMIKGTTITNEEIRVLHNYGHEYVPGFRRSRGKVHVRSTLRKYVGNTERRSQALSYADSRWKGANNPELLVPGYPPLNSKERQVRMPGGEI